MSWTQGHQSRRDDLVPLSAAALGELAKAVLESSLWWCGCRRIGGLTNSATSQAQILGFELPHPNIYLTYDLLKCMKGLVL